MRESILLGSKPSHCNCGKQCPVPTDVHSADNAIPNWRVFLNEIGAKNLDFHRGIEFHSTPYWLWQKFDLNFNWLISAYLFVGLSMMVHQIICNFCFQSDLSIQNCFQLKLPGWLRRNRKQLAYIWTPSSTSYLIECITKTKYLPWLQKMTLLF